MFCLPVWRPDAPNKALAGLHPSEAAGRICPGPLSWLLVASNALWPFLPVSSHHFASVRVCLCIHSPLSVRTQTYRLGARPHPPNSIICKDPSPGLHSQVLGLGLQHLLGGGHHSTHNNTLLPGALFKVRGPWPSPEQGRDGIC